jgi:phosphoadenosine phosphosulfate reductase
MTLNPRSIAVPSLADVSDLGARLAKIRAEITGRIVFTTSFGLEDQVIVHAIFTGGHDIEVVTLDTGRLFAETYDVWAATEERYQRRIIAYVPETDAVEHLVASQGINGFRQSVEARQTCCDVRKVAPLRRARWPALWPGSPASAPSSRQTAPASRWPRSMRCTTS